MRPQRSIVIASHAVLAPLMLSGCAPDEPTALVEVPPAVVEVPPTQPVPPSPPPEFRPPPRLIEQPTPQPGAVQELNQIRSATADRIATTGAPAEPPQPPPRRLVFECAGGITFAVRTRGDGVLDLYPPKTPGGSIPLSVVPSASGMHYRIADIDFFSKGDVATLEMGRDRYVDCVANPAASTWQDQEPRTGPIR